MPPRRRPGTRIAQFIESEDEGEEYEDYGEVHEDEEEEDEEEEEDTEREYIDVLDSPRVSQNESEEKENQKRSQGVCSSSGSQEDVDCKHGDTEGLSCLICMEVWTNGGDHQVW